MTCCFQWPYPRSAPSITGSLASCHSAPPLIAHQWAVSCESNKQRVPQPPVLVSVAGRGCAEIPDPANCVMIDVEPTCAQNEQLGGSGATITPRAVTFRDRRSSVRAVPHGRQGADPDGGQHSIRSSRSGGWRSQTWLSMPSVHDRAGHGRVLTGGRQTPGEHRDDEGRNGSSRTSSSSMGPKQVGQTWPQPSM